MQIIKSQGNIVEKIIRDKRGKLVLAKFFVYESAGRVKARLLEFTYIEQLALKAAQIFLPFYNKIKSDLATFFAKKTPAFQFVKIDSIDFSGSKPRAPTF